MEALRTPHESVVQSFLSLDASSNQVVCVGIEHSDRIETDAAPGQHNHTLDAVDHLALDVFGEIVESLHARLIELQTGPLLQRAKALRTLTIAATESECLVYLSVFVHSLWSQLALDLQRLLVELVFRNSVVTAHQQEVQSSHKVSKQGFVLAQCQFRLLCEPL